MESKHEKFCRLAENRVNNALKQIELIRNLSSKSSYEYTQQEANAIIRALKQAVGEVEKAFSADSKAKRFSLK